MEPFYFGEAGRRLFGVYHPPGSMQRPDGVVIAAPLFAEYLRSHSCLRRLALGLAARGLHVLRFDYFGTGDSDGRFDSGTPEGWIGDIRAAVAELEAIAGVRRIRLVGVRLGATLAAHAARDAGNVDRLAIWDPVVDGAAYVGQLRDTHRRLVAAHRTMPDGAGPVDETELVGFPVTARMLEELEQLALPSWSETADGSGASGLLVLSEPGGTGGAIVADAEQAGVAVERVEHDCDWHTYAETVLFPHEIIRILTERT